MERKVDMLGRLTIPVEYRRMLSLTEGSYVEMELEGDKVVITKSDFRCIMCGSHKEIKDVKGVRICKPCIEEVKEGKFYDAY